jgi:hypothetical protein
MGPWPSSDVGISRSRGHRPGGASAPSARHEPERPVRTYDTRLLVAERLGGLISVTIESRRRRRAGRLDADEPALRFTIIRLAF